MFRINFRALVLVVMVCYLSSCSVKKHLGPQQALLVRNKVEIEKPYNKEIKSNILKYCRQKPNRRFMVIFNTRPYFYIRGSVGRDNAWRRFQRNTLGEQPVIVDSLYIDATLKSFGSYLQTEGYYYPDISYTTEVNRRKKATVTYHIKLNKQYIFGEYNLQISDKNLFLLIEQNMDETFIRTGRGFHHDNIKKERERIVTLLRNNGYYGMSNEFVDFDVDTTSPDGFVTIGLNVSNINDSTIHKQYYIKGISVEIENTGGQTEYQSIEDSVVEDNIRYHLGGYKLNPNILTRNIQFETGELYSQHKLNRTYSRLTELGIFSLINIQPQLIETPDSGFVMYTVKMIPAVKYSFTLEPQAITSDQNNTFQNQSSLNYGVALTAQVSNRNVFRNAEVLQLSFRSSFEAQGKLKAGQVINATEQSVTASLIMPRTLLFPSFDKSLRYLSTRTIISASAIYEVNTTYKRTVFTTGLGYQFNKKLLTHYFSPIEASFIRSEIIDPELQRQSESDIFLQNTFSNNFILDTRYGLSYTNKPVAQGLSFINIRWDAIELAGNMLTAINKLAGTEKKADGSYHILGVKYFQYAKSAIDIRYNTIYDQNNASVFRLFTGLALPFGNTPQYVPFERRFFIGGVNSLRAWKPRGIGPGSFTKEQQLDYSGEVKIEANAEYRFNIYNKWLEGALFTDVGNVWAIRNDPERPGANFDVKNFYKSLAADAGFGIRFNFSIIIIRFDLALPLYDPTYPQGASWVIRNIGNYEWLKINTQLNFGIGYPF